MRFIIKIDTLKIKGKKNSKRSTLDNEESSLKKKKKSKEKKVNIKSISNRRGKWRDKFKNISFLTFVSLFYHSNTAGKREAKMTIPFGKIYKNQLFSG